MDLLERDHLLGELDGLLARAASSGSIALVVGEAGVGKTTLVDAFVQRHRDDAVVLLGRCDPLLTPRALGPLHDLARDAGGQLASALADGAPRERLLAALLDQLRSPGDAHVVVVEDAHWADEATMDLLVLLARRIGETTAMLLVTYRDDEIEIDHPLRTVVATMSREGAQRLAVPRLSESAVAQLARNAGRTGEGLFELTGGNPLLVSEVLVSDAGEVPASVSDLALGRYAGLPDAARSVVRVAAVVPSRAELPLVQRATGLSPAAVRAGVVAAVARGLLVSTPDAVGFRHELLRRAVESTLDPVDRRHLNQEVLDALAESDGVDIARLVHHAREAGDVDAVLRNGPIAAERAAAVAAHREAVGHYRAVLAHRERIPVEQRITLLHRYSTECYLCALSTEAVAAGQAAVQLLEEVGDPERLGAGLRWLSRLHWWDGNRPAAEAVLARAISTLESVGPGHELGMAYSSQSQLDMLAHRSQEAIAWAQRALEISDRLDDDEVRSHALTNIGSARMLARDFAGRADLEQAFEIAERAGLDDDAARALVNLASSAVEMNDWRNALADIDRALAFVVDRELAGYVQHLLGHRARFRLNSGDWAGAEADAREALSQSVAGGIRVVDGLIPLGLLQARRGDEAAAATFEQAASRTPDGPELQWSGQLAAARAEHAWLCGDDAAAVALASTALDRAILARHHWLTGELLLWTWLAGGEPALPEEVAEPYGLLLTGDWRGAAREWAEAGDDYHRALALSRADDGDPAIEQAISLLHGLGAAQTIARLRRDLRARGHRRIPRGPNRASTANPAGLTGRQVEVLELVAEGLTDAEIGARLSLSVKTVGHHVSAVLGKLGVSSRRDAVTAYRRSGRAKDGES